MDRSTVRRASATLALYCAVVAGLTWPLARHLGTHLPHTGPTCDFDLRQVMWALAWQTHALVTAPSRLFEANIYHPTPHALLYGDAAIGALPYFFPTFLATGNPVLASNLLFLGGLALTACTLHLVVVRWTGCGAAGFVAAGTLLTTPWVLTGWVPAAPGYALMYMMPPIVYLAADTALSHRRLLLLAALLVLQGAVNPYYAAGAMAPVAVLACARLASTRTRRAALRLLGVVSIAALALAAVYAPYAWLRLHEPDLAQQSPWALVRQAPHLLPLPLPSNFFGVPLFSLWVAAIGLVARCMPRRGRTDDERTAWRLSLLWVGVGFVIALPSTIVIFGTAIHVRYADLVDRLPIAGTLRDPTRIRIGGLVGLAILAGVAFAECARRLEPLMAVRRPELLRIVAAVVLVLSAVGRLAPWPPEYPLSVAPVRDSRIMAMVDRSGGPVLQLPVDGSLFRRLAVQADAMFASIGRWRPLLNGYGGFYPREFTERMRLAARLPDADALAELRRTTGLALVVVRGAMQPARPMPAWEDLARRGGGAGLRLIARDGRDMLFAVADSSDVPAPARE